MAFSTRPATTVLQPLHDLRAAADTSAHLQALRQIKNELSGHLSRKIEYIHNGLIHLLANSLASLVATLGNAQPSNDDELTCTHVAQLLYLIAHGRLSVIIMVRVLTPSIRRAGICTAHPRNRCLAKPRLVPPAGPLLKDRAGGIKMPQCHCR